MHYDIFPQPPCELPAARMRLLSCTMHFFCSYDVAHKKSSKLRERLVFLLLVPTWHDVCTLLVAYCFYSFACFVLSSGVAY